MFDFVRKHTKVMMFLMFLLIIPAFVLVGVDGYRRINASGESVATVGNHSITQGDWDAAHKAQVDRVRASNPKIDVKLLDTPEARFASLERLVRERVISDAAQDSRLQVTDLRLAKALQEDPTIASLRKPDGSLDMDRYRQLAASQGMTPEGFETNLRRQLSLHQVEAGVTTSTIASGSLANVTLNAFFERREVQISRFNASDYIGKIAPSDAEVEAYYQANPNLFQAPEVATIEYTVLDLDAVKKSISLNESDVKSYYEQNAARLSGKEERRASHILINASKDLAADARDKARQVANGLLEQVRKAPESFAEVAKKHSQDAGSAPNGGDLDYFGRGAMVKPFEEMAFSLKKGEISGIVETDFGFHIIKLVDIKAPKQRSFEELRESIESDLKTQQAQKKFAESAEAFTNAVYEQADDLKAVAERLKLEIKVANNLTRTPAPGSKGPLANSKFLAAIFSPDSIANKRNSEAIEVGPNQLAAARITAYSPARTRPLAEVKDGVKSRLVLAQASDLAKKEGREKLAQWRTAAPATLAAAVVVSRDGQTQLPPAILDAVLHADATSLPTWVGVDLGTQGFAVVRINQVLPRNPPPPTVAEQERKQFAQAVATAEGQAYYKLLEQRYNVKFKQARPSRNAENSPDLAK